MIEVNAPEIHTEELSLNGLTVKFFVKPDEASKGYAVLCKAFDNNHSLLWSTYLLDASGKNQTFLSLPQAIARTRTFFAAYKK
ncbi:MAG TPA: hypothetical protein VGD65_25865 [Chryseosolibacter sp.]